MPNIYNFKFSESMMLRAAALAVVFAATPIAGFASMPEPKPEKPGKTVVAMSNHIPRRQG